MYNSYFGFVESPFTVTPDPRFFYTNRVYLEAYATLRYGIESKKGFIVITDEVGTGKTTLLRKLLHSLEDTVHSVFIFNTDLSFPELLQLTLHDLGLTPKDSGKVTMLQELNDYLIKQLKQGHTVSILIDEAQNLSDQVLESLRLLSNLETDQEKLIQIVLMGQPELHAKLAQPKLRQFKQRVALQCRLSPLADEEVGPYIDFRLRAVGYEGNHLFRSDAVERIALYSKGIPRVMNIICDNALLLAFAASQRTVSADMVEEAARDLGLACEFDVIEQKSPPISAPRNEGETRRPMPNEILQQKGKPWVNFGIGALVTLFVVLVTVASVNDFQELVGIAERHLASFQYRWLVPVTQPKTSPEELNRKQGDSRQQAQRVTVQNGSTVHKIAAEVYGAHTILGIDLIKEFNPQIRNLNRIVSGRDLLLPPLTQETLVREQPNGLYRLIAASFFSQAEADAYSRDLGKKGYQVTITPNRVSDNLVLQRVQIDGLRNPQEAMHIWESELRNDRVTFVVSPAGEHLTGADSVY